MANEALEIISLNMLQRMSIQRIAEDAFKRGIKDVEGLEGKELYCVSNLGQRAERLFYEYIQALENKRKFPKSSQSSSFKMSYTSRKRT